MYTLLYDLSINLAAGIIYGISTWFIISVPAQRRADKENFENGKQNYQRYIEQIKIEIKLSEGKSDFTDVIRLISEDPMTPWGERLAETDAKRKCEIRSTLIGIGDQLNKMNALQKVMSHNDLVSFESALYKCRIDILKMPYTKRKNQWRRYLPWGN